jgi:hypothetical protein
MVKKMVIFDGNQKSSKVKEFFKTTGAEALSMNFEVIQGNIYFVTEVDVEASAYERYIEKNEGV